MGAIAVIQDPTAWLDSMSGDLAGLFPEITVVLTLVLLLGFDLLFKGKKSIGLASIAFIGLSMTLAVQLVHAGLLEQPLRLFQLLLLDDIGHFVSILLTAGLLFALIIAAVTKQNAETLFEKSEGLLLLNGLLLGALLMVKSTNLLMVYVSIELVSICSYLLTGIFTGKSKAEAALKYLLFGGVASAIMLFGMSWLYGFTGSLDLNPAFFAALQSVPQLPLIIALVMTAGGLFFKLSAVPFHIWSPDVFQAAPTPVVAVFSGLPKLASLIIIFRVANGLATTALDWQMLLSIIAMASMLFGNFSALRQSNAKRMMAYSSIAHAGFLLVGLITYSNAGGISLLFYASVYLVMNLAAFLLIAFLENRTGSSDFNDLKGVGNQMPYLGILVVVVMIALTGLPPTAGFSAKLYVFSALWESWQAQDSPVLLWLFVFGLINSVIALFYYLKLPYFLFFKENPDLVTVKSLTVSHKIWGTIFVLPLLLWFFQSEGLLDVLNNINFGLWSPINE